jgi:beta-glucosidase
VQSTGVMAQVKHLVAYDEETGRDNPLTSDSIVSQRALQEIYLPPFQDAVQRAHVASAMCSYNAINGVPGCQNAYAMTQVLDEQFGFTGFITSDWYALQGAALSINAGTDMEMPDGCYFSTGMMQALANGSVSMATLNGMVDRILTEMFDYHLIGAQPTGKSTNFATSLAHETSALKIAEAGTVLLKNAGGLLPLARASVGSVAVIGNDATDPVTGGSGSASVIPEKTITPLAGIRQLVGSGAQVTYSAGSNIHGAAAAAAKAKVAVVFVDLADGEEDDVSSIALSGNQNSLIAAVAAANPHTVVVINSGDAVLMPWINQVAGVIEAWYPGEQDGSAIANILFGDYDPSGRLPVTFPQSESQLSATSWPSLIGGQHFNEGIDVGYRYFETAHETPLFPFGYGLSYTSFKLSKPTIPARTSNGHALVHVTVQNSGPRSGADVVELYVGEPSAAGEPPAQLKGFDSVQLAPGQKRVVTFRLVPRDLSYWSGRWAAMAGAYQVYIGTSATSLPIHLSTTLTRNLITSPPPGPAPAVSGHDSPLLAAECPVDSLGPLVNTTISTGVVSLLADLP